MLKDESVLIILISGKAEAGKDVLAKKLAREFSMLNPRVLHFAEPLKELCKLFGWDGNKNEIGRDMLQFFGSGARKFDVNFWVKTLHESIIKLMRFHFKCFIVADCRYPNEINYFKDRYSKVFTIRIERPDHQNALTQEQREHPSECSLDDYEFDYTLLNRFYLSGGKPSGGDYLQRGVGIVTRLIRSKFHY